MLRIAGRPCTPDTIEEGRPFTPSNPHFDSAVAVVANGGNGLLSMHQVMGGLESATSVDWRRSRSAGGSSSSVGSAATRDATHRAQRQQQQQQHQKQQHPDSFIAHRLPDGMPGENELLRLASDPSQLAAQLSSMEARLLPALEELQSGKIGLTHNTQTRRHWRTL